MGQIVSGTAFVAQVTGSFESDARMLVEYAYTMQAYHAVFAVLSQS
jgi:hypothetical protein